MIYKEKLKKIILHPIFMTISRVLAVPIIIILLMYPGKITTFIASLVFSLAAITDYFDGYFARKLNLVSNFGKIFDPIADKLLMSLTFIMLVSINFIPSWIVCIIIARELAVNGLRTVIAENGQDVAASWLGKYKTGFQIACIIPLLIHYPYWGINFHGIGIVLLYGALIFTLWSGLDYFIRFRKLISL
ncbi:MAG: CDP-diacylglycerol--glycerol-3-phosphate 3-phosphatidyltransferase [Desulfobacteraceae bacterium 4572_130]|nr:MAG: CDP-diacylglycerol--glycerol-3-phosphate 3-phosphatidyltransferase [Desulfobacteraceae bacterium 4572_130]